MFSRHYRKNLKLREVVVSSVLLLLLLLLLLFTWLYFDYVFVQLTCCFAAVLKTAKALDFITFFESG